MNRSTGENELTAPFDSDVEYVAFDLETTGLAPQRDRVVEIGAVRFRRSGEVTGHFEQLINPGRPMPAGAQAVHGISDADLASAPFAHDVLPSFLDFLGDPQTTSLVAHHASFDAGFLGSELRRASHPPIDHRVFDTLPLARRRRPDLRSHRLDHLVAALAIGSQPTHRALADAFCVKDLWLMLGGFAVARQTLTSFQVRAPREAAPSSRIWIILEQAIASGQSVWITYDGGSRGLSPRRISPQHFVEKEDVTYVVAFCHYDLGEKSFRMDRIRSCEPNPTAGAVPRRC